MRRPLAKELHVAFSLQGFPNAALSILLHTTAWVCYRFDVEFIFKCVFSRAIEI
jgi:hypothetical protein